MPGTESATALKPETGRDSVAMRPEPVSVSARAAPLAKRASAARSSVRRVAWVMVDTSWTILPQTRREVPADSAMPRSRRIAMATSRARSGGGLAHRDVAHLAPGTRLALAVEVQVRARMAQHRVPLGLAAVAPDVAQQVHHHRRAVLRGVAQRQAAEHAHLLLELRGAAGVDRVVAAVVRARRDLVQQQLSADHEHLDRQHAHVARARVARRVASAVASRASASGMRAGAMVTSRMPLA